MKDKKTLFLLILGLIIAIETTYLVFSLPNAENQSATQNDDTQKKLAEEYLNQGLYEHAVSAYNSYLADPGLAQEKKSNISYIIGNIYMDNLGDYADAMANFVRAKVLYPATPNISEINKKMVMCLERMDRPADAERELKKTTALKKEESPLAERSKEGSIVVAKIGDRNITLAELNREIDFLPDYIKENYKDKDRKLDFLKQYVTEELLYDSAKRRGLDNNKDVVDGAYRARKQLMIQVLLRDEVNSKMREPSEGDLKLYYEAHKDKYMEEKKDDAGNITKRQKEFNEARDAVMSEYVSEKEKEVFSEFINKLMKTGDVAVYENQLAGQAPEK